MPKYFNLLGCTKKWFALNTNNKLLIVGLCKYVWPFSALGIKGVT